MLATGIGCDGGDVFWGIGCRALECAGDLADLAKRRLRAGAAPRSDGLDLDRSGFRDGGPVHPQERTGGSCGRSHRHQPGYSKFKRCHWCWWRRCTVNAVPPLQRTNANERLLRPLVGRLGAATAWAAPAPPRGRATLAAFGWRSPLNGQTLGRRNGDSAHPIQALFSRRACDQLRGWSASVGSVPSVRSRGLCSKARPEQRRETVGGRVHQLQPREVRHSWYPKQECPLVSHVGSSARSARSGRHRGLGLRKRTWSCRHGRRPIPRDDRPSWRQPKRFGESNCVSGERDRGLPMARGTAWPVPRRRASNSSADWGVGDNTSDAAAVAPPKVEILRDWDDGEVPGDPDWSAPYDRADRREAFTLRSERRRNRRSKHLRHRIHDLRRRRGDRVGRGHRLRVRSVLLLGRWPRQTGRFDPSFSVPAGSCARAGMGDSCGFREGDHARRFLGGRGTGRQWPSTRAAAQPEGV
jgi:hypothetical protein